MYQIYFRKNERRNGKKTEKRKSRNKEREYLPKYVAIFYPWILLYIIAITYYIYIYIIKFV